MVAVSIRTSQQNVLLWFVAEVTKSAWSFRLCLSKLDGYSNKQRDLSHKHLSTFWVSDILASTHSHKYVERTLFSTRTEFGRVVRFHGTARLVVVVVVGGGWWVVVIS